MVRRLFFHMGAHKTATTLVQIRLRERLAALNGAGICYVEPRRILSSAFEDYVSGRGTDLRHAIADFDDMVQKPAACQRGIIVFEDILGKIDLTRPYLSAADRLQRVTEVLRESAGAWQMEPLIVVRRYDTFWLSCYRHNVKNGHIVEFDKALQALAHFSLDWRSVVSSIEAVVGHEVPVRRYEDFAELADAEVLSIILGAAGIEDPRVLRQPWRKRLERAVLGMGNLAQRAISGHPNASLSDRGLILAEAIRPLVTREEWRGLFRPMLAKHFNRILEPDSTHFVIPKETRVEMEKRYERDREWFAGRLEHAYPTS